MKFQIFVICCASLMSQVYTQEKNHLLNLLSQGFYEPVKRQEPEDSSQKIALADPFHQFQYNREPVDNSLLQEFPSQEPAVPRSECQYWCVTPEKKFYCCDDDSDEELEEHLGVCPVIHRACHVTDGNLAGHFPREDDNHVTFPDIFKEESCLISPEVLKHLRLYHQRHHNVYNGNISVIEIFGSQHNHIVIAPRFFGDKKKEFGIFKEELNNKEYERPFFRALKLALNIGTLAKVIPHIPYITNDPGRDHYSDKYTIYDSYLPEDMLISNEYESMLLEEDVLTSNKRKSLLLSRIARHI